MLICAILLQTFGKSNLESKIIYRSQLQQPKLIGKWSFSPKTKFNKKEHNNYIPGSSPLKVAQFTHFPCYDLGNKATSPTQCVSTIIKLALGGQRGYLSHPLFWSRAPAETNKPAVTENCWQIFHLYGTSIQYNMDSLQVFLNVGAYLHPHLKFLL